MESLARAANRRPEPPEGRLTAVVVPTRPLATAAVLAAQLPLRPSMAWAPRAGDEDEWSFVGFGATAHIQAAGDDRFVELRARADRLFERLERPASLPHAPRLFGGFAFDPGGNAPSRNSDHDRPANRAHGDEVAHAADIAHAARSANRAHGEDAAHAADVARAARSANHAHGDEVAHAAPATHAAPGPSWAAFGDASFTLPRVLYSRAGDRAYLTAFVPEAEATAAAAMLDDLRRALDAAHSAALDPRPTSLDPCATPTVGNSGEPAWNALITRALTEIERDAFAKVVLCRTRHLTFARDPDLTAAFAVLDARFTDCARFFFERDAATFLGASPERLLFVAGRRVVTEALAGSIARTRLGDDPDARARLLASAKDRAEHTFVIDAVRAALAPSCDALTIRPTPEVRSLAHLHHLATPIVGTLTARAHLLDLVRRLHPTPALCGSPKAAARAFILANEPAPRGWYGGGVGWFDARGDGAIAVAIRSALVTGRDAWIYAGAGIVRGSDPALELAETIVKERAMRDALGAPL